MAEHEPTVGATDEWYTPKYIFDALGLTFDLDPCSPGPDHWVPAKKVFTSMDNGLLQPWSGLVWMNPPFGARNGHVPWLQRFISHGNGVGCVRAYTSSGWWHEYLPNVDIIIFPKGKTKFIRPDGSIGKQPGHGVALFSIGTLANTALINSGLGMIWQIRR